MSRIVKYYHKDSEEDKNEYTTSKEYQSDGFQTEQMPRPHELPGDTTPETTVSRVSRPFLKFFQLLSWNRM